MLNALAGRRKQNKMCLLLAEERQAEEPLFFKVLSLSCVMCLGNMHAGNEQCYFLGQDEIRHFCAPLHY